MWTAPLFHDESTAVRIWLEKEGFEIAHVSARTFPMGPRHYVNWLVEFEETANESISDQEERYEALITEDAYVNERATWPCARKVDLPKLVGLGLPRDDCEVETCSASADTYFLVPGSTEFHRQYCECHANWAHTFIGENAGSAEGCAIPNCPEDETTRFLIPDANDLRRHYCDRHAEEAGELNLGEPISG